MRSQREASSGAGPARSAASQARDVLLLGRVRARDPAALEELYDRHAGVVMALALRVLRDRAAAEETLVDVFAEVWERAARFDPDRGSPGAYLMNLTRSRAIDRLRSLGSRRHGIALVVGDSSDVEKLASARGGEGSPLDAVLHRERRLELGDALRALTPEQRHAIELAFLEGLSHSEVSQRLAVPLGTVKTRIRQGLLRVRRLLESGKGE